MYYVYIIQSDEDGSYYIGYTHNIEKRLIEHNSGKSSYTKSKMPWNIKYSEEFEDKSAALKREKFLKKQRNRTFYQKLIEEYLDR